MLGDVKFTDLIKIKQLRCKQKFVQPARNKNFEEFSNVYKEAIAKNGEGIPKSRFTERIPPRYKTICIEMPVLGSEQAIVETPKKYSSGRVTRKPVPTQDESIATETKITKWGRREPSKVKKPISGSEIRKAISANLLVKTADSGVQVQNELKLRDSKSFEIQVDVIKLKDELKVRDSKSFQAQADVIKLQDEVKVRDSKSFQAQVDLNKSKDEVKVRDSKSFQAQVNLNKSKDEVKIRDCKSFQTQVDLNKSKDEVKVRDCKSFQTQVDVFKLKDENKEEKKVEQKLLKDTHSLLRETKHEIDESAAQLEVIKKLITSIKSPENEKEKKTKPPAYKPRKKEERSRYAECITKKYMTTLNNMDSKLRKLEEKYFKKPKVVYKNVRDICTTYSDASLDFMTNSSTPKLSISATLKGIKEELEIMANTTIDQERISARSSKIVTFRPPEVELNTVGDTFDHEKKITPSNFSYKQPLGASEGKSNTSIYSFKKPIMFDELTELSSPASTDVNYMRLINQSEQWFKKTIITDYDIETFCQEMCRFNDEKIPEEPPTITAGPDDQSMDQPVDQPMDMDWKPEECESAESVSHDSAVDKFYYGDSSGFFSKDLQAMINGSAYLSKEFNNMKPSVKVFSNDERYVKSKDLIPPSKKPSASVQPSLDNVIDNLSMSLKDSIYYKAG